jgi:site-specific recombinase XerD
MLSFAHHTRVRNTRGAAECLRGYRRGTSRAIDLRTVDRHPLASAGTLALGLRRWAIQGWLGHRSISSTVVYTALVPNRFKDFWRD